MISNCSNTLNRITMKKLLSIIFTMGILLSAISCQESEFSNFNDGFKITASIAPMETRVDFAVNSDKTITPNWTVGDEIIGCDDQAQKFTFKVKSVNGRYAELDANGYVPGGAKRIFAVYYPGKTVDDITVSKTDTSFNVSLPVDLTSQDGKLGGTTPSIMTASTDITDLSALTLNFAHQTAIIAVSAMKVNPGDVIKNVAVTGARTTASLVVSSATGSLAFSYLAARKPVSVATDLTADGEGIINTPVYVSVLGTTEVNLSVVATNDKGEKVSNINPAVKCTLEKGKYYYTSRVLGNVATIVETGKQYGTIEEAFRDAETSGQATIKLLADCTIIEDMPAINGSITIDLAGKVLSATASVLDSDDTMMYKRVWIENGNVIIMDSVGGGKLKHSAGNTYNVVLNGEGTLTVESGSVESLQPDETDGSVAILARGGQVFLNGGKLRGNSGSNGTVALWGSDAAIPSLTIPETSTVEITAIDEYAIYLKMADADIAGGTVTTGATYALNAEDNCYVNISGGKFSAIDPNNGGTDAIAVRFYNGPQLEITGGEFFGTGRAFSCNGSSDYTGEKGKVSITGGTFKSMAGYTLYGGRFADILVEGGSFYSEKNSNFFQGYTNGSLTIADCYAYTGAANVDTLCIRGNYTRAYGGFYNTMLNEKNITNSKVLKQLATPVVFEGLSYGYTLGDNESYVAEVNGTPYVDMVQAVEAAKKYVDSGDPVIKLISDCKLDATVDITNEIFKPVTLDLNGYTLTTSAKDSCMTTTGELTITDNSADAKGMILATVRKPIFLLNSGTINIKKVTIECTATGAYTDAQRAIISVKGTSGNQEGRVNISDGAKIIADNWFKCIYVSYGYLTTENCEITSGYASDKAYYGIYGYTGANVTVNDGTSIRCCGKLDSCGVAFHVASGNTSKGSLFIINGGYFYGGGQTGKSVGSGKDSGAANTYAFKTLTVNGGYFRQDITPTECHYGEGKSLVAEENKHNFMGEELTYNYVVK